MPRWVLLASVIGIVAGLGAVAFYEALHLSTKLFLGGLAGYRPPRPAGEGGGGARGPLRRFAIPLSVVLGALCSGLLVFGLAPETEGHGTDAAIDAVHHNPRGIRARAVVVKIVASALTIGSGGSGGREGPTAQISAGFGSLLARLLDLSPEDARIAVSVGIGSGIGAIFRAPLGGALLAADVVYRDDFEFAALLPGLFASVVAYGIFGAFFGYQPLFTTPTTGRFDEPALFGWFVLLGLVAGGMGLVYAKVFYGTARLARRLPVTDHLRPALGGLLVGALALGLPEVLGTGYGFVQEGLSNELARLPLVVVAALPFARILATALSIGTGGSGGVFGPGMVIGAFTGLAFFRLLEPVAPGLGKDPAVFVVVGMMATFGGISRAPVSVMLMVAEMTGNLGLVAPAIAAVATSWFVVRQADDTMYRAQLRSRADSPAGRLRFGLPLLATIPVSVAAREPLVVLEDTTPAGVALARLRAAGVPGAPVVDAQGTYLGAVTLSRLEQVASRSEESLGAHDDVVVGAVVDPSAGTVDAGASLDTALEVLVQAGGRWVPVTSGSRRVVGVLSVGDLVAALARGLSVRAGQVEVTSEHAIVIEEQVSADSPLLGLRLADAGLPSGCVVVTVVRGGERLLPTGSTVLHAGDLLSMLVPAANEQEVRALLAPRRDRTAEVVDGGQLV